MRSKGSLLEVSEEDKGNFLVQDAPRQSLPPHQKLLDTEEKIKALEPEGGDFAGTIYKVSEKS